MTDFSFAIVHEPPPRPKITFWLWLQSWFRPVRGWTLGRANSMYTGITDARTEWVIHRGDARPTSAVGMLHTCGTPSSCRCNTDRQFQGDDDA